MGKALVEFSGAETALEALKGLNNNMIFDDASKITAVRTQIDSLISYNEHNTGDQFDSSNIQLKDYSNQENYLFNELEIKSFIPENKKNPSANTSTATKSDSSKSSKSSTSFHFQGI